MFSYHNLTFHAYFSNEKVLDDFRYSCILTFLNPSTFINIVFCAQREKSLELLGSLSIFVSVRVCLFVCVSVCGGCAGFQPRFSSTGLTVQIGPLFTATSKFEATGEDQRKTGFSDLQTVQQIAKEKHVSANWVNVYRYYFCEKKWFFQKQCSKIINLIQIFVFRYVNNH